MVLKYINYLIIWHGIYDIGRADHSFYWGDILML